MKSSAIEISSKPKASQKSTAERRAETTNRAATEIIGAEIAARERKTARLRAMRIAKEHADEDEGKGAPAKREPSRKRKTKTS